MVFPRSAVAQGQMRSHEIFDVPDMIDPAAMVSNSAAELRPRKIRWKSPRILRAFGPQGDVATTVLQPGDGLFIPIVINKIFGFAVFPECQQDRVRTGLFPHDRVRCDGRRQLARGRRRDQLPDHLRRCGVHRRGQDLRAELRVSARVSLSLASFSSRSQ